MTVDADGGLLRWTAAPSEAFRLLAEARREWIGAGPSWGRAAVEGWTEGLRDGTMDGRLWPGPSAEAVALAIWRPGTPAGRRCHLIVDRGFRHPAVLSGFVHRLERSGTAEALLAIEEPIPGFPSGAIESALAPLGYRHAVRVDHEFPPGGAIPRRGPLPAGLRPLSPGDAGPLAELLREAYADDPIERALARHEVDPWGDPGATARRLLTGELGPWWGDASFVVPDPAVPARLLAATVVNDHEGPLLTQVVVAPRARRQGLARALLGETVAAVRRRTERPLRLVVTRSNDPAVALYRSLGFILRPETLGGYWLSPVALGAKAGSSRPR